MVDGHEGIGDYIWGVIYTYAILFPMSLPRELNSLRFSSVFGVLCSMYLAVAVMVLFLTDFDKTLIPSKSENFHQMEAAKFEFSGISGAFPLIIFAYMYQLNIPALYSEMEKPNETDFLVILSSGTAIAVLFYLMVGIFGYAIFA